MFLALGLLGVLVVAALAGAVASASLLRRWSSVWIPGTLGVAALATAFVLVVVASLAFFVGPASGFAEDGNQPFDSRWIGLLTMVGVILIAWQAVRARRRDTVGPTETDVARHDRVASERRRVEGSVLVVLGGMILVALVVLASIRTPYSDASMIMALGPAVALVGLSIGLVLVIWGGRLLIRGWRSGRRSAGGDVNRVAATALGRYVEGKWVCFEHDRSWCPVCSAQARTQQGAHDPTSSTDHGPA